MNRIPKKLIAVGYCIAMLFASAQDVSAFYNPSTGRWLSRDPFLETAFAEFRNADVSRNEILPDVNEYQFVGNRPMFFVDYLGGGIFCKCNSTPPSLPFELLKSTLHNKADNIIESESDMGTYECTMSNQGATVKATVGVGCIDRTFTWEWLCGCAKKNCHVRKIYTCGTSKNPKKMGKPVWILTSRSISKDCY